MTDPVIQQDGDTSNMAKLVYILYLASIVVGITGLIGVIIAYIHKSQSALWLQSHYQFIIRTFWIGLLFSIVGALLTVVLIGFLVLLFLVVWLIIRCVKGFQYLEKREPHPDPTTWLF
ncbi:DUF4870 family protein [Ningiella sp. W23]|uniref:DUF4870 family protein n=1 Tax=Ningiella sp. W23 TaxID=3023715 RepID=UPI003756C6C4